MLILLDSGPLGLLSNPTPRGLGLEMQQWARAHLASGTSLVVPEIADYEVRRELIRAGKTHGVARLDELCDGLGYHRLSTSIMRDAAELWADARNHGRPTAHDAALDGDVLLAGQARNLLLERPTETVVVATTNVRHLERYVDARIWQQI